MLFGKFCNHTGKGEEGDEESGKLVAKDSAECSGDQLRAGLDTKGDIHAADDGGQTGEGTDHQGIHENFEDTKQILLHRTFCISGCMGDGGRTKACLVGESAAAQTPNKRFLQCDTAGSTQDRLGRKGGNKDLLESRTDGCDVGENNDQSEKNIESTHKRDQHFSDLTDALDAAEENHGSQDSQKIAP